MAVDNQENALVCLKIIFSLHKNFRHVEGVRARVSQIVRSLYTNLEATRVILFKLPQRPVS